MVDGLALCSCACVTCLWCSLLALCFPKLLKKIQESDSSICCAVKPKNPTSVIENRRTSIDETMRKKSPMRCKGYRNRSYEPKCTVKIIRKTKRSSPRRDVSKEDTETRNDSMWQDNSDNICTAAHPKDRNATYTVAYSNPKHYGVQTDLFRRRRRSGFPEKVDSSDDEMDRKKRYRVNAKLTRRQFSSSDECIRSRGGGQSMKKTTRRFPQLFSTRYGSSIVYDRDERRRI